MEVTCLRSLLHTGVGTAAARLIDFRYIRMLYHGFTYNKSFRFDAFYCRSAGF